MLSTGSTVAVEKTSEFLQNVMDKDYANIVKKKLDDVYRTGGVSGTGGVRGEKVERELRQSFIVSVQTGDYMLGLMEFPQDFVERPRHLKYTYGTADTRFCGVSDDIAEFLGLRSSARPGELVVLHRPGTQVQIHAASTFLQFRHP